MNDIAPIALFCYNRLDTLEITINSLLNNYLSSESLLFIFSDGPKSNEDEFKVSKVRDYIKSINGFKNIQIIESSINKGLSMSVLDGVNYVFQYHDKIIILEDDLELSNNFLQFINTGLNYYNNSPQIISICGYSPFIKGLSIDQIYFTKRSSSWGWGTWKNKWTLIKWDINSYKTFNSNYINRYNFNKMGSDMSSLLNAHFNNNINSWSIVYCFNQYLLNMYSIHPALSKVRNMGINHYNATNTKNNYYRFRTILDSSNNMNFIFSDNIHLNKFIIKQFIRDNSIFNRIFNKIFILFIYVLKYIK
jgi:hypothetical protein